VLAALPAWLSDNIAEYSTVLLAVAALVVFRLVQKTITRIILLGLLVGAATFVYANQDQLRQCATTCECRLVKQDVSVPACKSRFPGE
jgi:chromate transport protein ChrA